MEEKLNGLSGKEREDFIVKEITENGNYPKFLLNFVPVKVQAIVESLNVEIIYYVSPDYLSLGTEVDFIRVPMRPKHAQKVLDHLGCILPTKRMVDQIYQAAEIKVSPQPINHLTYSGSASSTYLMSNRMINEQLAKMPEYKPGMLLAGHKKDIVLTNQLLSKKGKVAIYGWHRKEKGTPIQPLYLGHGDFYVDYSHGVRLVNQFCVVNGVTMDLREVLGDKKLGPLLTGSDPLKVFEY